MYSLFSMSTIVVLPKYDLDNIDGIINEGFEYTLPTDTIALISLLSEQVGAPSYVRTPIFNKKDVKRKRKNQEISDADWDAIRNFQKTVLEKKEGIDQYINSIRKCLNKLTDNTYNNYSKEIIEIIDELILNECSEDDKNQIGEAIFNIASGNAFYSELYALLFKALIQKFDFMEKIFQKNFSKYLSLFTDIKYCSPDDDYDAFCDNNDMNDKRKATSLFYVNLMKVGILDDETIIKIIIDFQDKLKAYSIEEDKVNECEEISENIFILIQNSCECLNIHESWSKIHENITYITSLSDNSVPSINNKIIFKQMDLLDDIKENS